MTNDYLVGKAFRSYLIISILVTMSNTLGVVVDNVIAGNLLGENTLSTFTLVNPVVTTLVAVSGVLTGGAVSLCNMFIGRNQREKVNPVFSAVMAIAVGSMLAATLVFYLGRYPIAALLGAEGEVLQATADYLQGFSLGFIPLVVSFQLLSFTKIDGSPRLGMYGIFLMTAVNILLDYLFAGPMGLGMFGMGLATTISYYVAVLVCCFHFFKKSNTLRLVSLKGTGRDIRELFTLGAPNALNRLTLTFRALVLNYMLGALGGVVALNAMSAQNSISAIAGAIPLGIGQTLTFIDGMFYGEEDRRALRSSLKIALRTGAVLCIATCVILFALAGPLAAMFGVKETATLEMAKLAIRFFCVSLPFQMVCNALISYYQSTRNVKMANLICVGHNFLFVVLSALAFMGLLGTTSVWLSLVLGEVLTIVALLLYISARAGRPTATVDSLLLLPENFGEDVLDSIEISVGNDMNSVVEASQAVYEFCVKNHVDKRTCFFTALSVEEMTGNVVRHGFRPGKTQFLDLRVLKMKDSLIFRMRDDGKPFNPLEYKNPETGAVSGMGIAMVLQMAEKVDYQNALNMNNLIIRFDQQSVKA